MELKEVKELLKAFDESGSAYMEIEQDGTKIKLKKPSETIQTLSQVVAAPQMMEQTPVTTQPTEATPAAATEQLDGEQVLAPLVGVFYAAPSPEEPAYVQVGDKVKQGQVICLIEAMKMMSEITSPRDGVVKQIYVKNQDVVGFEEPLFLIGD